MKRYIVALSFTLLPVMAVAEPYPSTLTVEEQERHEFIDAQKNSYPSGRDEGAAKSSPPLPTGPTKSTGRATWTAPGTQQ